MSKIGRKPIPFSSAQITIDAKNIKIKGPKGEFSHVLADGINVAEHDKTLVLTVDTDTRVNRMNWGLHRALLANKIKGVETGFETKVKIVGLGYKAQQSGSKLTFSLGYSHKKYFELPDNVTVDIDRTGQNLVFKSNDNVELGRVCDGVRNLRLPEPYKGTGIIREHDVIRRKAGKTKA